MINLILVYPPKAEFENGLHGQGREWFPIGIASLAASAEKVTKNITCLDLFDESYIEALAIIKKHLDKDKLNLVGFTVMSEQRHVVFDLVSDLQFADANIKTIVGGPHASIMYEQITEFYPEIDHIVVGEGENSLNAIITGYQEGQGVPQIVKSEEVENLSDLPFAYHGLQYFKHGLLINAKTEIPIIFSRGCTDRCTFCSTYKTWPSYRTRSSTDIMNEMLYYRHYYGSYKFKFHDDSCTANTRELISLCRKIKKYKFQFELTARADQFTEELIYWLAAAGCYKVAIGIESGSEKMRKAMNKRLNNIEKAKKNIKLLKEFNIHVHVLLIVGYPGETQDTIEETAQFLKETKPSSFSHLPALMVVPGTPVYNLLKNKSWIDDNFWLKREPCPYYTGEHTLETLHKWGNRLKNAIHPKKVLIASIINEEERVFEEYLKHLNNLEPEPDVQIAKFFILHNCENLKKYLKPEEYEIVNNKLVHDKTHTWNIEKFKFISEYKNLIAKYALDNKFDYIFWVDSDLMIQPPTLRHLLNLNLPIVSEIFWTKWPGSQEDMPNCWDVDQYNFYKHPEYLKIPGTYRTGGTGACILVNTMVYRVANYSPIPNISFSVWEDRAFCIRAACSGVITYIDTHYPANHLYTKDLIDKYFNYTTENSPTSKVVR